MSKEVKRYDPFGYDGLSALMHEDAHGDWIRGEDYDALCLELAEANADFVRIANERDALLAERDAAQKDAERMAFIEEHPNWLRKHKKHWQCVNPFTNYEYPVFKTAREAVDAALQGEQP